MKIIELNIQDIKEYDNNSKLHPEWQIEQIARSISEFGFNDPIAINKDKQIIEGHGRYLACKKLGINKVPCIVLEGLTEAQERAYIIAHNKLTMNTDFDLEKLKYELNALKFEDVDLEITGFDIAEIDNLLNEGLENDVLELEDIVEDEVENKVEGLVCPHCGHKAKKKEFLECDIDG